MVNKEKWLNIAEILDALRIIPRSILAVTWLTFLGYVIWVTSWYMGIPVTSGWDMGFISSTISALGAAVAAITNKYTETGRDWSKK